MAARHEPSAAHRSQRLWPLMVVLGGVTVGIALAFVNDASWRLGCLVIGASLGIGAVERIALPDRDAGLLQIRSKSFDVAVLLAGAATIIALTILVPEGRR